MVKNRKMNHGDFAETAPSRAPISSAEWRLRSRWLGKYVLPHETMLRKWLQMRNLAGLEIEDVVQETYARILSLESFDHITKPRTYTFQVATSIVLDHVRRLKIVSIDAVPNIETMIGAVDELTPEGIAGAREDLRRLARDLAALPDRVRDVFRLRRIDGLSQRETAQQLGIAESTVEKHMARGLIMMADWFSVSGYGRGPSSNGRNSRLNRQDDPRSR